MEDKEKNRVDLLIENVMGMVETYMKIIQLEFKAGLTNAISMVVVIFTMITMLSFVTLFLSIGLAIWLGEMLQMPAVGFMLVALLYLILFFTVYLLQNQIKNVIFNLIDKFTKNDKLLE